MALPPVLMAPSRMAISRSGKARLVRAGVSDRGFLILHRGGARSVFIGRAREDDRANSCRRNRGRGGGNARLARESVEIAPSDSLASGASPPWGPSVAGACTSLPAMPGLYRFYVR